MSLKIVVQYPSEIINKEAASLVHKAGAYQPALIPNSLILVSAKAQLTKMEDNAMALLDRFTIIMLFTIMMLLHLRYPENYPHGLMSVRENINLWHMNLIVIIIYTLLFSGGFRGHPRPKIFSISCSFSQNFKIWQNHMLAPPPEGWRPLLRGILDPPLLLK